VWGALHYDPGQTGSGYHNVDTINTFPTKKKEFVNGVLGLGFMGNQTRLVLIFFRNSNW
jgi:hypothetical protein